MRIFAVCLACLIGCLAGTLRSAAVAGNYDDGSHNCATTNAQNASWAGRDMHGQSLEYTDLRGANLQNVNLRNAQLKCIDLRGADLRGADLRGTDLLGVDFDGARLDGASFDGMRGNGVSAPGERTALSNGQVRAFINDCVGCNFARADLRARNLSNIKLTGANLSDAISAALTCEASILSA